MNPSRSFYTLLQYNHQNSYHSTSVKNYRIMELYNSYEPLKWPPLLPLAELHLKCAGPGKDNIEGVECPCCERYEKIKIKNWFRRSINKDFKVYGGGIPAYFQLIKYCVAIFMLLSLMIVIFHIYILEKVCSNKDAGCVPIFSIIKVCNAGTILNILNQQGENLLADVFTYLQLGAFVVLILATIGMKLWLSYINNKKIIRENKVYSEFSLMIKNIPKYYQIEDVRKEIEDMIPGVEICELFFVFQIAEFETKYKSLFDLYYEIKFTEDSIKEERGGTEQQLKELIEMYVKLYQEVDGLKKKLCQNNGRAIIVFNSIVHKEEAYQKLKIGECSKFVFHVGKLFKQNTRKLHFFADKIMEPQEIIWKYVGESSVTKTKVRIETTLIVLGFMIISFGLLYFPIYQINEAKVESPHIGTALNIVISIALVVLSVAYRMIILRLMPRRHPSSRDSQSYFIVINTIIFHFLFYVVAPASYYFFATSIKPNIKLAQLFFAVFLFILMNILVAFIDIRYRIFKGRRNKILESFANWGKFCQIRLHEELKIPSFPIQFKIMVVLNIWSFNAFYVFQIPYLLVIFWVALIIMYWVDKKNLYKHYKMQVFLSIQMEQNVQRDFIFFFLICLCCGYAISITQTWQYYLTLSLFILAIIFNYLISYKQTGKDLGIERSMTLVEMVKAQTMNPKQSMMHQIQQTENRDQIMMLDETLSSKSLGSAVYQYGYHEQYQNYLSQFRNKSVNGVMQMAYVQFLRANSHSSQQKRQSELVQLESERYQTEKVDENSESSRDLPGKGQHGSTQ